MDMISFFCHREGCCCDCLREIADTLSNNVVYVKVADSNEALGRLAYAWYDYPSSSLNLVGVTGTNGRQHCLSFISDLHSFRLSLRTPFYRM
jgi:UDP-N-acetylmuramyl tripeptide synthase